MNFRDQKGQSLFEIVMAVTIAGLLIGGITTGVLVSLRSNSSNISSQIGYSLALETLDEVKSYADSDWPGLYGLSDKTSNGQYYIVLDSGTFTILSGQETVLEEDIKNGLVGHWKFDSSSTTTAYDFSGNGNNGTLYNGPTKSSSCKVGGCLTLAGGTDYVDMGDPSSGDLDFGSGSFSIATWFKATSSIQEGTIVAKGGENANSPGYRVSVNRGGTGGGIWVAISGGDGANRPTCTIGEGYADSAWHHLAAIFDRSSDLITVYVDEQSIGSCDISSITGQSVSGTSSFEVGDTSASTGFTGDIDDMRVYNRALASGEVERLYGSRVYTGHFSVENVSRDSSGGIVTSGGTEDPSTQKVTAYISWDLLGDTKDVTVVDYVTRTRNIVTVFTDWSGESGVTGPITAPTDDYNESYGLELTDNPGSITVD